MVLLNMLVCAAMFADYPVFHMCVCCVFAELLAQLSKSSSASSSHNWAQQLSESAARCKESIVAECGYDSNTGNWRIKSFRDDKNAANFITTVMATMESIIDNITKEQLIERCKRSKV